MKKGITKAVLYALAFLAIQLITTFVVQVAYVLIQGGGTQGLVLLMKGQSDVAADANVLVLTSVMAGLAALLLFARCRWCELSASYMQSRPWQVLIWSMLVAVGAIVPSSLMQEMLPELPDLSQGQLAKLLGNNAGYLALCLFAPFVEEVVFRGAVLRALLQAVSSRWTAIAVSAALFAIAHLNPAQMPYAFVAGLFLGWTYCRTGSILPGVAFHWVNNSIVFILCRQMPQFVDGSITDIIGHDTRHIGLAIIFSLFVLLPSLYQLNMRMRKANH